MTTFSVIYLSSTLHCYYSYHNHVCAAHIRLLFILALLHEYNIGIHAPELECMTWNRTVQNN